MVGGRLKKIKDQYSICGRAARFSLVGDVVGASTSKQRDHPIKLSEIREKRTKCQFSRNIAQPYLLQNYISNHFALKTISGKTTHLQIGGELTTLDKNTLRAGRENIQNLVYFQIQFASRNK